MTPVETGDSADCISSSLVAVTTMMKWDMQDAFTSTWALYHAWHLIYYEL